MLTPGNTKREAEDNIIKLESPRNRMDSSRVSYGPLLGEDPGWELAERLQPCHVCGTAGFDIDQCVS